MGPRTAGFLLGGFFTTLAAGTLFHYDFLRKKEVTNKKTEEIAVQADIIVKRFRVIESGLRTLSAREEEARSAAAAVADVNASITTTAS
jgi:hypothetical protein